MSAWKIVLIVIGCFIGLCLVCIIPLKYGVFDLKFNEKKRELQHAHTSNDIQQSLHKLWDVAGQNIFKNITPFARAGTLLGLTRDQQLIPWDEDIDVWFWSRDYDKVKTLVLQTFNRDDYVIFIKKISVFPCYPSIYILDNATGVHLDIHFREINKKRTKVVYACHPFYLRVLQIKRYHDYQINDVLPPERILYRGSPIFLPAGKRKILKDWYGDWTTPKKY